MSRSETRAALDQAIRDHLGSRLDSGEVLVGWAVVGVTRTHDDGGSTMICADDGVPGWQLRGMLHSAIDMVRAASAGYTDGDEDDED